jgi:hypothetical protein
MEAIPKSRLIKRIGGVLKVLGLVLAAIVLCVVGYILLFVGNIRIFPDMSDATADRFVKALVENDEIAYQLITPANEEALDNWMQRHQPVECVSEISSIHGRNERSATYHAHTRIFTCKTENCPAYELGVDDLVTEKIDGQWLVTSWGMVSFPASGCW